MFRLLVSVVLMPLALACVRNPGVAVPDPSAPAPAAAVTGSAAASSETTRVSPRRHRFADDPRAVHHRVAGAGALPRTWRGLRVGPRDRCPGYRLPPGPDPGLAPRLPALAFDSWRDTAACAGFDSEHAAMVRARLVPADLAHDLGLCRASDGVRAAFGIDPDNVVHLPRNVAALRLYTSDVGGAVWLPGENPCWYVQAQLRIRRRYDLAVTPLEAEVFEEVLGACPRARVAPYCGPAHEGVGLRSR